MHYAADIMRNYDDKVSKLLDAGVEVLIYVGVGELVLQSSCTACWNIMKQILTPMPTIGYQSVYTLY